MHGTRQAAQEGGKGALLFGREAEGTDFRIERGIRPAAVGIKVDNIFQRGKASIVHVRRSAGDLAQRGRFECAAIARIAGNRKPAVVGDAAVAPGEARVVELFVRISGSKPVVQYVAGRQCRSLGVSLPGPAKNLRLNSPGGKR